MAIDARGTGSCDLATTNYETDNIRPLAVDLNLEQGVPLRRIATDASGKRPAAVCGSNVACSPLNRAGLPSSRHGVVVLVVPYCAVRFRVCNLDFEIGTAREHVIIGHRQDRAV